MAQFDNVLIHFLAKENVPLLDLSVLDLSIYKNREFVGKMSLGNVFEIPVEEDCELLFVYGRWNNKIKICKGIDAHVFLSFGGAFGGLKVYTSNDDNADEVFQQIDKDSSNTRLYVILVAVFIIAIYVIIKFI